MRNKFAVGVFGILVSSGVWAAGEGHLTRIERTSTLRVCVWPEYYGISFRSPKTGQLSGVDVDLAKEFKRELKVQQLEFVDSSFARLIPDVLEDRCDIAMFAIGITPQRSAKLHFSSPHLQSDIYAITTHSHARMRTWADIDQPGVVVAVAKGTLHEPIMREKLKFATLRISETPYAREQDVEAGRADVFMTDYPYGRRMLDQVDWARLISPPARYHVTPYAWAMAPGDAEWHRRVEGFMQKIKHDGRLIAIARRYKLDSIALVD